MTRTGMPDRWMSADGICWRYDAQAREWQGVIPGVEGQYIRDVETFRGTYPEAPLWDDWIQQK